MALRESWQDEVQSSYGHLYSSYVKKEGKKTVFLYFKSMYGVKHWAGITRKLEYLNQNNGEYNGVCCC